MPKPKRATRVLLVRHGLTPTTGVELYGRKPGVGLSEAGHTQARDLATRTGQLKGVAAVYASPLERAQQTAAPLAEAAKKPIETHEGLIELDVGDWTGRKLAALSKLDAWRQVQRFPSGFTFPGGESFRSMADRICETVTDLAERHRGKTVIAVSHADPIRAYMAYACGTHLDLFQRLVVSPCSVSAVLVGDAGPTVLAVNSTSSLGTLAPA